MLVLVVCRFVAIVAGVWRENFIVTPDEVLLGLVMSVDCSNVVLFLVLLKVLDVQIELLDFVQLLLVLSLLYAIVLKCLGK